jgi:hypothetical protein
MGRVAVRRAVLGAVVAEALDLAVLGGTATLAYTFQPVGLLFLAAVSGVVVAPMVGARFASMAVAERPGWATQAGLAVTILSFLAWPGYALVVLVASGAPGGNGSELGFLAYAAIYGAYAAGISLAGSLPVGFVWWLVVRRFA